MTIAICRCCRNVFRRQKTLHSRTIRVGHGPINTHGRSFPQNVVCNQKYNVFTFIPLVCSSFVSALWHLNILQVLFQQFKFFLNLYFLLMACSQFIPAIQIGAPITYWGPLVRFLYCVLLTLNNSLVELCSYHYIDTRSLR